MYVIEIADEEFQTSFSESENVNEDVITRHMRLHPGRSRSQAIADLTAELPDPMKEIKNQLAGEFSDTIENMVRAKMAQTGMSYSDGLRAIQIECPDLFSEKHFPSREDAFDKMFSEKITGMVKSLQAENPALTYSEGLRIVQGMAVELFTEYVSLN